MKKIPLTICSRDYVELTNILKHADLVDIVQASDSPAKLVPDKVDVLLASPDFGSVLVPQCENIVWMQSTWAGNAQFQGMSKANFSLTTARGIFAAQMREYVFTYLLHFYRNVTQMDCAKQLQPKWQPVLPNYIAGKTLGILGAGSIGCSLLDVAKAFDMQVIGVNSTGEKKQGFSDMFTLEQRLHFAQSADAIVNLLPDTALTRGILDHAFFANMRPNSMLINAGRGSAVVEQDLLHALEHGKPDLAVLDVFEQEPLPKESPLWLHPKVMITHHTAAISRTPDVAQLFLDNAKRYASGKPLAHNFNFKKGY